MVIGAVDTRLQSLPVQLADIEAARDRIAPLICETPLKQSYALSERLNRSTYLKLETVQPSGSFKLRGATNALLSLPKKKREAGVIAMSSGNHGRSLAFVAHKLGIPATIVACDLVPEQKLAAIRQFGADVVVQGSDQNESTEWTKAQAEEHGLTYISPYDDPRVIAGQGTIALELLERLPSVDTLVVQVSGGGLMSGIAIAAKAINPGIRLIGVTNDVGAAMYESVKAGRIVDVEEVESLADALQGGLPQDNKFTFEICKRLVDQFCLVNDDQIAAGMAHCFFEERLVLEGAGAAGVSLLLSEQDLELGETVAAVCTGDNISVLRFLDIIRSYETANRCSSSSKRSR